MNQDELDEMRNALGSTFYHQSFKVNNEMFIVKKNVEKNYLWAKKEKGTGSIYVRASLYNKLDELFIVSDDTEFNQETLTHFLKVTDQMVEFFIIITTFIMIFTNTYVV
ncbi:hypothetical protein CYY_002724 [Polysphondylium violaceum]|uniref:Uncharacterized protein n=1 Tax=Polysphondylium violaceum TaxID=133409 RepID=A0A8J4PXP0_9MYCE|nr:hypothetical protein CYY_002724 [Polysphondylium violaceum]